MKKIVKAASIAALVLASGAMMSCNHRSIVELVYTVNLTRF